MVWPTIDVQFMPGFLKNIRNEKYNMSYCYKLIPAIRHPVVRLEELSLTFHHHPKRNPAKRLKKIKFVGP
jgi:hypothetical protein